MPAARLTPTEQDAGALRGLRVTPQRRAIMSAFAGGATEHLSADEVHARASSTVPELSRGTVYSTLAELTELGLLGALGSPEPVRYEINATDHDHFRCRLCLRLHDVELPSARVDRLTAKGFGGRPHLDHRRGHLRRLRPVRRRAARGGARERQRVG